MPSTNQNHHHFKIFKPYGFLSQFVPEPRMKKKGLLSELSNFPDKTMAIGRLDHDSEGLLLLTTDGMKSFQIRDKSIEKEYYVQVDGEITEDAILQLQNGVDITVNGKYRTLPCKVFALENEPKLPSRGRNIRDSRHGPTSWISITLCEGKKRQIRKMTAAVGFATLRLVRVRIGDIHIDNMNPGDVIELANFNDVLNR